MKHLFFALLTGWFACSGWAQSASSYFLEVLDEPYETLANATVLSSEDWDDTQGWDDPEFMADLGFDFNFLGSEFSTLIQGDLGTTLVGISDGGYYGLATFLVLGDLDVADLGSTGVAEVGTSTIQWHTEGEAGNQVFTLEYANTGFYDEVYGYPLYGPPVEDYSFINFQLRLYEWNNVIEIHFGESYLSAASSEWLNGYEAPGWHGFVPGDDGYGADNVILTNVNAEQMFENFDEFNYNPFPFTGFPESGRLFRYHPLIAGCDNPEACNYYAAVNYSVPEDCIFPIEAGTDCDGNCLNDADMDGLCDEVSGCTEGLACNYNPAATLDDGSCDVPETGYGCDGECLNDTDGDGVCDANEVAGCEDPTACNFVEMPTDLVPCIYAETYYDCDGECLNDTDGDGICDELEVFGCTDFNACNYEGNATEDDGSCYSELPYTLVGDTLLAVGDTVTILCDGASPDAYSYYSWDYGMCSPFMEILYLSSTELVAVMLDGFEGCTMSYWEYSFYTQCSTDPISLVLDPSSDHVPEPSSEIRAYPNPASTHLNLELPATLESGVHLQLFNSVGQVIRSQRAVPGRSTLFVSDLPAGIYLLEMGDLTQRVVIQH